MSQQAKISGYFLKKHQEWTENTRACPELVEGAGEKTLSAERITIPWYGILVTAHYGNYRYIGPNLSSGLNISGTARKRAVSDSS